VVSDLAAGMANLVSVISEKMLKLAGMDYQPMLPVSGMEQVAMWDRMDDVIMVRVSDDVM